MIKENYQRAQQPLETIAGVPITRAVYTFIGHRLGPIHIRRSNEHCDAVLGSIIARESFDVDVKSLADMYLLHTWEKPEARLVLTRTNRSHLETLQNVRFIHKELMASFQALQTAHHPST